MVAKQSRLTDIIEVFHPPLHPSGRTSEHLPQFIFLSDMNRNIADVLLHSMVAYNENN